MVLEYIEGMTLYEYLKSKNYKIDEKTIRFIMKELLISLEYIHSNKIVHRDIKPENIIVILNKEKEIINLKIIDFGLSQKLLGYNLLWGKVGTPIYFAPEIALEKSYSYVNNNNLILFILIF